MGGGSPGGMGALDVSRGGSPFMGRLEGPRKGSDSSCDAESARLSGALFGKGGSPSGQGSVFAGDSASPQMHHPPPQQNCNPGTRNTRASVAKMPMISSQRASSMSIYDSQRTSCVSRFDGPPVEGTTTRRSSGTGPQ